MKTTITIAALLAAITLGGNAYARGGDGHHDRGWDDQRGRYEQRHDHWRHDRWRHQHRPHHYSYSYGYGYPPPPPPRVYYESPAVHLPLPPLPPPPHEVLRDILRGH